MLTAVAVFLCLLLLLVCLYVLQAVVFAYRGFLRQNGYYKSRFYKKVVGIILLLFLIKALNEFSKALG